MKSKIILTIILVSFIGYLAEVSHARQEMTIYADGKTTIKDVGAYDYKTVSREKLNGKEYVRINLAELSDLCANRETEKLKENYVLRGSVFREAKLDAAGQFGFVRLGVFCCVVHAVAIGLPVQYDKYDDFKMDQWVKVYGRIKMIRQPTEKDYDNDPYAAVKKDFIIVPDKIVKINVPSDPYIYTYNCQNHEPYDY